MPDASWNAEAYPGNDPQRPARLGGNARKVAGASDHTIVWAEFE